MKEVHAPFEIAGNQVLSDLQIALEILVREDKKPDRITLN